MFANEYFRLVTITALMLLVVKGALAFLSLSLNFLDHISHIRSVGGRKYCIRCVFISTIALAYAQCRFLRPNLRFTSLQ